MISCQILRIINKSMEICYQTSFIPKGDTNSTAAMICIRGIES